MFKQSTLSDNPAWPWSKRSVLWPDALGSGAQRFEKLLSINTIWHGFQIIIIRMYLKRCTKACVSDI